jgi:hypothetical protein
MKNKEKTIFEALSIDQKDYIEMVNILQNVEVGMDLNVKGERIKDLKIKKKNHCFGLFIAKMLEDGARNQVVKFYTETPKLSQDAVKDIKIMKDALIYMYSFLQGTDIDISAIKLFSVFIPVSTLIASPITPLSIAVELFVKLIKFHKFSYGEVLAGINTFLEIIDPFKEVPEQEIN